MGGHHRNWFHNLNEDAPPQSGLDLYSFSKGLGYEICRVFTENYDLHVRPIGVCALESMQTVILAGQLARPVMLVLTVSRPLPARVSGASDDARFVSDGRLLRGW